MNTNTNANTNTNTNKEFSLEEQEKEMLFWESNYELLWRRLESNNVRTRLCRLINFGFSISRPNTIVRKPDPSNVVIN